MLGIPHPHKVRSTSELLFSETAAGNRVASFWVVSFDSGLNKARTTPRLFSFRSLIKNFLQPTRPFPFGLPFPLEERTPDYIIDIININIIIFWRENVTTCICTNSPTSGMCFGIPRSTGVYPSSEFSNLALGTSGCNKVFAILLLQHLGFFMRPGF